MDKRTVIFWPEVVYLKTMPPKKKKSAGAAASTSAAAATSGKKKRKSPSSPLSTQRGSPSLLEPEDGQQLPSWDEITEAAVAARTKWKPDVNYEPRQGSCVLCGAGSVFANLSLL